MPTTTKSRTELNEETVGLESASGGALRTPAMGLLLLDHWAVSPRLLH